MNQKPDRFRNGGSFPSCRILKNIRLGKVNARGGITCTIENVSTPVTIVSRYYFLNGKSSFKPIENTLFQALILKASAGLLQVI
jgi:hypothetical protein